MDFATARRLPAGDWDGKALLPIVVPVVALGMIAAVIAEGTTLPLTVVVGSMLLFVAAVWPKTSIYIAVLMVTLGDIRLGDPNTPTLGKVFTSLVGMSITPLELVMLMGFLGLCARLLFDSQLRLELGDLALPIVFLMVGVLGGVAVGMAHNADLDAMRQETRSFFYLPAMYLLVIHFMKSRESLERIFWVFVLAVNLMALENIYRYFTSVKGTYTLAASEDLAFAHENSLMCAAVVILLVARLFWSERPSAEWRNLPLIIIPVIAMLVMRRRAGIVALDIGLLLLALVLLRENVKMFLMVAPLAILGFAALVMLTWNEPGSAGQIARSYRTVSGQSASVDQSSDEYRKSEQANVQQNIKAQPLIGMGYGMRYNFYIPLADLSFWPLWRYVPHNTVLWMWMKAGILGFASLVALFAAAAMRSMQIMVPLRSNSMKALAFGLGAIVIMFLLYSWADLGLVSARAMVMFGLVLGSIGALAPIAGTPGSARGTT